MLKIDKVQLEILINGDPARLQLNQLSKEAANLKKEYAKAKTELEKKVALDKLRAVESQMEAIRNQIGLAGMSMKELGQRSNQLKAILNQLKPNTAEFAAYRRELNEVNARQRELRGSTSQTTGIFGQLKEILPTLGIGALVGGLVSLGKQMFSVREEFQKYEAILKNTLGSEEAGRQSLSMLSEAAAELPISLKEATESYIKLVNRGINPSKAEMIKLTDIAMSQGKSLNQFVEAELDAMTGEYERLKEFGIRASKEGDKVTFMFKNQKTVVQNNEEAIQKYLLSLGELPGVAGSSAAVMQTLEGKVSNLGDSWDRMLNNMGKGTQGILNTVIGWLGNLVEVWANTFLSMDQIRQDVMDKQNASNMENALKEIDGITQSLVKNGIDQKTAHDKAVKYYADSINVSLEAAKEDLKTATNANKQKLKDRIETLSKEQTAVEIHFKKLKEIELKKLNADLTDDQKKKSLDAGLKALVVTYNKEKLIAAERFASGKISKIEYNNFIKALEEQNNRNRLALMKVYGQDISAEEAKQVEERIKQAEESGNDLNKVYEDLVKVRIQLEKDSEDDLLKVIDETNKEQQKKYKEYEDQQTSDLNKAGTIVNELRNGNKNEELKRLEEQSEALRIARDNDLITETEYQNVLSANRIEAEAEKISVIASYAIQGAQMVQQIYDTNLKVVQTKYDKEQKALDDKHTLGLISDTEYNKKKKQLEEQSEKEQKAIKKRQANVEFIIQMASIIASTAQAVAKSVAASPLTLGLPWSAINAGIGIAQLGIATYQKAKVSQAAKGRYNVIGADDGRAYNNVPYTGEARTGMYNSPMLVAERASEIVIDNPTVKRLMANEPYIIDRILANRVPQHATGNYPVQGSGQNGGGNDQLVQYMAASMTMMAEIKAQFAQGIEAKMSNERFDIDREKWNKQKADVTRT